MRRVILSCGQFDCTIFFPHCLINGMVFGKKKLIDIKCVLIFSAILSEIFLIVRRTEQGIINLTRSLCKAPRHSCHISVQSEFF